MIIVAKESSETNLADIFTKKWHVERDMKYSIYLRISIICAMKENFLQELQFSLNPESHECEVYGFGKFH